MQESELSSFDKFLLFMVRYGLFFVFVIPFIVVLAYIYPWVSGKVWGYELMVEILFPLWIMLSFRRKEYRPEVNAFLWAVLGYFSIATVSMIIGDMPHRSMWSKPDRLTGMFFQYHLLAFWLMASTTWRGKLKQAATATVTAATIAAIWGFGQVYMGFGGCSANPCSRGEAALGNTDYLGQYLVPHVFLVAWLAWHYRKTGWKWLLGASGIIILMGIASTKSRGALLGVLMTLGMAMLFLAFKGDGRLKKISRWGLLGFVVLFGLYIAANKWSPSAAWLYNNRISIQFIQESTGSRKLLYANVIKVIKARPVLGWGPENFESGYYYFYDPVTLRYSDYETRQDHPHSLVLDLLANVGFLGLLSYSLIFFFAWRLALRSKDDRFGAGMLILATAGHLAANLFIFDTPVSYANLFVLLSFLALAVSPKLESGEDELSSSGIPVGAIAMGLSLWVMSYAVTTSMHGAWLTSGTIVGLSSGQMSSDQVKSLIDELKKVKTPEQERYIRAVVSNLAAVRGEHASGAMKPVLEDLASFEYKQSAEHQHDYVNALVTATSLDGIWPRTAEEQTALEEAAARAQRLSPNRQEVFWLLGQIAFEKGDLKTAEADYLHAIELDPAALASQGNYLAFLISSGQLGKAQDYLKSHWTTIATNQEAEPPVAHAIAHLLDIKKNDDVLKLYEQVSQMNAVNFEFAVAASLAAIQKGDFKQAQSIIDYTKKSFSSRASLVDQYIVPQLQQAMDAASVKKN